MVFLKHGKGCTPQRGEVCRGRLSLRKESRYKIKGANLGSGEPARKEFPPMRHLISWILSKKSGIDGCLKLSLLFVVTLVFPTFSKA